MVNDRLLFWGDWQVALGVLLSVGLLGCGEVCEVGILVIGSYIYHLDVIITSAHIYVNRIQIRLTYYLPVYCIYKLVQLSQCSSDI